MLLNPVGWLVGGKQKKNLYINKFFLTHLTYTRIYLFWVFQNNSWNIFFMFLLTSVDRFFHIKHNVWSLFEWNPNTNSIKFEEICLAKVATDTRWKRYVEQRSRFANDWRFPPDCWLRSNNLFSIVPSPAYYERIS